jgi:oligosaccharyltransferase complex subunit gamma
MDWARMAFFALSVPAVALFLRSAAPVLTNRWTWASLTVIPSLVMTSGYMFVRIRGVPHTGHNGQWVAQGFQNQFGQEVSVISMLCELGLPLSNVLC